MKFCKRYTVEYSGLSGIPTTSHLISLEDILNFHGKEFADRWKEFASNTKTTIFKDKEYYYFSDYKRIAITTDMWLNSV